MDKQELELIDNGVYSLSRKHVIVDPRDWTTDIRQNIITELPIEIDETLRSNLTKIARKISYKPYYDIRLGNFPESHELDAIKEKFSIFDEIHSYQFLRLKAGYDIWPHSDPNRHVNIYIPLYPAGDNYAPLEIYHNNKIYGIPSNTKQVYAWNTKTLHAVFNQTEYDRYNLQLSIYIPYTEFYKKYLEVINV